MEKSDIVSIASKQRHLNLLRKVQVGKELTPTEIKELAKYEQKNKAKGKKVAKIKKPMPLNPRQLAFCREYVIDHNGKQAAIRAGYAEGSAEVTASRVLSNANVKQRIAELEKPAIEKAEVTVERIIQELANIAFFDIRELYDDQGNMKNIHTIPESARRAISGMDVFEEFQGRGDDREQIGLTKKVRMCDKLKALELLGKTNLMNMFTETINHKVNDGCGVLVIPQPMDKDQWSQRAKDNQDKLKVKPKG